jgi:hypothetical protein
LNSGVNVILQHIIASNLKKQPAPRFPIENQVETWQIVAICSGQG